MQQVGTVAAYFAEKLFSLFPKVNLPDVKLTVRQKHKIKNIFSFFLLFVFPIASVYLGYDYVQDKGGFLKTVSSFENFQLKDVNLIVYHGNKIVDESEMHVSKQEIIATLPFQRGMPLLEIDPEKIRTLIKNVSWVKSARVKLILPSKLSISIQEQTPFARWQKDGVIYLIDEEGHTITDKNITRYNYLPLVIDDGANTRAYEYKALMQDYAEIFKYIKSAIRVDNRRWTLITYNDTDIILSENNPRASLEKLLIYQKKSNILEKEFSQIDISSDKIFIKRPDSATLSVYDENNI